MKEMAFGSWEGPLRKLFEFMGELQLESWEQPLRQIYPPEPDVVVEACHGQRRRLKVCSTGFLYTRGDNYLCARELDAPEGRSWLLLERRPQGLELWGRYQRPVTLESLSGEIENGRVELARFSYFLTGQGANLITHVAFTLSDGESAWLTVGSRASEDVPFEMVLSQDQFFGSNEGYAKRLEEELARPDSDARFALNWKYSSHVERQQLLCGTERLQELCDLMRCIVLTEPRLGESGRHVMWSLYDRFDGFGSFAGASPEFNAKMREKAPRLPQLAQTIVERWPLAITEHDLATHPCLRRAVQENLFWPIVDMRLGSPRPPLTQHKFLEAFFPVRDWLETYAPERMVELLPR